MKKGMRWPPGKALGVIVNQILRNPALSGIMEWSIFFNSQ
jgi:hypothetical protein